MVAPYDEILPIDHAIIVPIGSQVRRRAEGTLPHEAIGVIDQAIAVVVTGQPADAVTRVEVPGFLVVDAGKQIARYVGTDHDVVDCPPKVVTSYRHVECHNHRGRIRRVVQGQIFDTLVPRFLAGHGIYKRLEVR